MPMTTEELLSLHERNTGHAGINALFSKAHTMDWDLDRDVDWSIEVASDDPIVDPAWSVFGRTPTFRTLERDVQVHVTRRELARTLNLLQVGESVAQDVCAKLALLCEPEDYRNHAVAQALDEARHHMAYVRFLEKMDMTRWDDVDPLMAKVFDELLTSDDVTTLVASEQFFLESLAMRLFERLVEHARHPLLRDLVTLIKRDESRHMGFGILYVAKHLAESSEADRLAFAADWLPRVLGTLEGQPGPRVAARVAGRLSEAGVSDAEGLAQRMLEEQGPVSREDREELTAGRRVPHLLSSCRRAGLLQPSVLEPLGLSEHPLIRGALRGPLPLV